MHASTATATSMPSRRACDISANGVARGVVPVWATRLTAFVDVQDACLWWMVCAWADDFTGATIDYGAWPDQGRAYFTNRDVKRTLARAHPKAGPEGRWYAGLDGLSEQLLAREWMRQDGADRPASRRRQLRQVDRDREALVPRDGARRGDGDLRGRGHQACGQDRAQAGVAWAKMWAKRKTALIRAPS